MKQNNSTNKMLAEGFNTVANGMKEGKWMHAQLLADVKDSKNKEEENSCALPGDS